MPEAPNTAGNDSFISQRSELQAVEPPNHAGEEEDFANIEAQGHARCYEGATARTQLDCTTLLYYALLGFIKALSPAV